MLNIQIFLWLPLIGCSPKKNMKVQHFQVQQPSSKWFEVQEGGADFAWYNKEIYGSIYVDSNCKQKFEDRPLRDSYLSLTQGIITGEPIQQNNRIIDNREALFTIQNGRIDGVVIRLAAVIMSKDECLYDFLYIAPPDVFDIGLNDFLYTVQSFTTVPKKTEGLPKTSKK